ncbi:uncharacterized protein LOC127855675 [Dreissena polymorpha]|uniref:uncharacterized protein LOC127855675 n=1 Tax=Dreissena polymorpha TaxID=45954 RepID=UPI002265601F|nr:uncharacterized protein LOC127855675 [Dreissena polymorpha]
MFVLEVSDVNSSIVWSNQKRFNYLQFEMKAIFDGLDNLLNRPVYVHDSKMGIVQNIITANVSIIPRAGGIIRDYGYFKEYPCKEGYNRENPYEESAKCVINDDQFVTLIEHGDWVTVKFRSTSGGFQKFFNIDNQAMPYMTNYYSGLSFIKTVEFRFDFKGPKHCSEVDKRTCPFGATILDIPDLLRNGPIIPRWLGWTDTLSGVGEYYMEVFKLGPNRVGRLVETTPTNPIFSTTVLHTNGTIKYPQYAPSGSGMYRYVADALDDNEEPLTRKAIPNFHGIVKYEIVFVQTVDATQPILGWTEISLKESFSTQRPLEDGDRLRVWVRATDLMGNQRADSTIIKVDGSKPRLHAYTSKVELNTVNGPYKYSSKVVFSASDNDSGVHMIGFDIFVGTNPNNFATMKKSIEDAECRNVDGVCFLSSQTVFLDNCWMLVGRTYLDKMSAIVNVTAYNQAMLGTSATINLGPVNKLLGLEKYDGPKNPRIVTKTHTGFRITWNLPEKQSCYGRADILIILSRKTAKGEAVLHMYYTPGTSNHFDILGLNPETEYTLGLNFQAPGTMAQQTYFLTTKTGAYEPPNDSSSYSGDDGPVSPAFTLHIIISTHLCVRWFSKQ